MRSLSLTQRGCNVYAYVCSSRHCMENKIDSLTIIRGLNGSGRAISHKKQWQLKCASFIYTMDCFRNCSSSPSLHYAKWSNAFYNLKLQFTHVLRILIHLLANADIVYHILRMLYCFVTVLTLCVHFLIIHILIHIHQPHFVCQHMIYCFHVPKSIKTQLQIWINFCIYRFRWRTLSPAQVWGKRVCSWMIIRLIFNKRGNKPTIQFSADHWIITFFSILSLISSI